MASVLGPWDFSVECHCFLLVWEGFQGDKEPGKYTTEYIVEGVDSEGKVQGLYKTAKETKPRSFVLLRTIEENSDFVELPTNFEAPMWSAIYLLTFFAPAHSPAFDFEPIVGTDLLSFRLRQP